MKIRTADGSRIPFAEIADYTIERGEVAINHLEGRREIQISADLTDPSESATDILADIKNNILPEILSKYPTVSPSYEGQNREADKLIASAVNVIPAILLLIYVTIAFTFASIADFQTFLFHR
uniref:efflux RND transporter permease subunit n=1 Tax=Roseivirga sp. TaxID=1964215 RepID=UPI004048CE3F